MKARDIMTPNPTVVTPYEPIARAAQVMRDLDVGIVPIVNDREHMRLEGVLTDRDIAVRCVAEHHGSRCQVRDHMTAEPLDTVSPDTDVAEIIAMMERDRVRRVPVVAPDHRIVGIIAQADLVLKLGPREPARVEHLVEAVSEPGHAVRR
jgi:CBS domain-containing protein